MRRKPPERRGTVTRKVRHTINNGSNTSLIVSYGIDDEGAVREAFCSSFKVGSDMMTLAIDASILLSRCLQHGDSLKELCDTLCEPRSIIGTICECGLKEEMEDN